MVYSHTLKNNSFNFVILRNVRNITIVSYSCSVNGKSLPDGGSEMFPSALEGTGQLAGFEAGFLQYDLFSADLFNCILRASERNFL